MADIHRRLEGASNGGFANETDDLMEHVSAIERPLNICPSRAGGQ